MSCGVFEPFHLGDRFRERFAAGLFTGQSVGMRMAKPVQWNRRIRTLNPWGTQRRDGWLSRTVLLCGVLWGMFFGGMPSVFGETVPVWELSKQEVPAEWVKGSVEKVGGGYRLRDGGAFAVPAAAFTDQQNFTVQVTVSFEDLSGMGRVMVMSKQTGKDDGFGFGFLNPQESFRRQFEAVVNKILMVRPGLGPNWPKLGEKQTFTLAVRDGYASFYAGDVPIATCLMAMVSNGEPLWIGGSDGRKGATLPVTVHDVKVYGAGFQFVSKREEASDRKVITAKGWALDIPKTPGPAAPKVLIYGDSISGGYRKPFEAELAKHGIDLYHCAHFVGGEVPEAELTGMAGTFPFDVVVFNNGLHSLSWTPETVSDEVVMARMRKLALCFKKGAPKAKMFYLLTTPHTAERSAPEKPVESLGDKNDVVVRLNTLSERVMKEEQIEVIDGYSVLAARLDLARGDKFHWGTGGYELLSGEILKRVLPALGRK